MNEIRFRDSEDKMQAYMKRIMKSHGLMFSAWFMG